MLRRFIEYFLFFFISLFVEDADVFAQVFDTLRLQYQYIEQIYPLEDGSFILIGQGEESIVERIDSIGNTIWMVSGGFGFSEDDILYDYVVHLLPNDSSIQIATARKYCDYYDTSDIKVYTISFHGQIMDSQLVRAKDQPRYVTLLSGNPQYPRLAYLKDNEVVLQYASADTVHLQVSIPGADSTINQLVGSPVCMALSPQGTLLVGTGSGSLVRFRNEGTGYHFFSNKFFTLRNTLSHPIRQLLSIDEEYYMAIYYDKIEYYSISYGWEKSFSNPYDFYYSVNWCSPYLYVMSDDTLYAFDHYLNRVYQQPWPAYEQYIHGFAIRNQTIFTVGRGYFYREGGFLGSENQITHEGPKYHDIVLVDFNVGPYDSSYWQNGRTHRYIYNIPNASVTIKNNSDFTVRQIQLVYLYPFSYCADGSWDREIHQMDLLPGETKSYEIHDIYIVKEFPLSQWYGACLYAIRPDNHADDHPYDNVLCKKLELLPSINTTFNIPIQHSPSIISDEIYFYAAQDFDFDLSIYNLSGIEVLKSRVNTYSGHSIELNFLPSGVYIFQYVLPEENKSYVEKIFKY